MAIFYSTDKNDPPVITRVRDWILAPNGYDKREIEYIKQNYHDMLNEVRYLKSQIDSIETKKVGS